MSSSYRRLRAALALVGLVLGFAVLLPTSAGAAAPTPECPTVLMALCSFDPAAYVQNDPNDVTNYGNYDLANRPADDTKITGVTIHDIEGSCEDAVNAFKDPLFFASATYVICADGRVIQMVKLSNITWGAANWWYNMHNVQIEHAGHAASPTEYTDRMYLSSAMLVRWLSQKFGFPLDRVHVQGHDNVPATKDAGVPTMNVDPGPFWDWQKYMALLGAPVVPQGNPFTADAVTIAPVWPLSRETVTGCSTSHVTPPPCVPAGGPVPTNFVYLRTGPSLSAPFIADPLTGPGSTEIENRSARAFYGQKFMVADRHVQTQGIWYKIWFGGQGAWFYSPFNAPTAFPATSQCATPKGAAPVAMYGRPLPELSEWSINFTPPPGSVPSPVPYSYMAQPGQCYSVVQTGVLPDHYFSWSYDNTYPRFRVVGQTPYVWVQFNGRQAFMKQSEVRIR